MTLGEAATSHDDTQASLSLLRTQLDTGEITAVQLTMRCLRAIQDTSTSLNAFAQVNPTSALAAARTSDERHRTGTRLSALDGIPIAIKDIVHIRGQVMTAGSAAVRQIPEVDASIVQQLRRAGAVILGSTRLHELAYGPSGLNDFDGGARNPRFPWTVPGGSSSGSAAAVAAGLAPLAVGSDTGGSIRGPATLCGIVGFKPTYRLLSTDGVLPTAPSLDHLGFFARTVEDIQLTMDALTGSSTFAESSAPEGRLAVFEDPDVKMDPEIRAAFDRFVATLVQDGWKVNTVTTPSGIDVMEASTAIMAYESYRVHKERLETAPERIGRDVRERLLDGARMPLERYETALRDVTELKKRMVAMTGPYDALLNPTLPIKAPTIVEAATSAVRRQLVRNTRLQNLLGAPAIALPGRSGPLPWGVQLFTSPGRDAALLKTASAVVELLP